MVFLLSVSAKSKEDHQDPLQPTPFWSSGRRIPPPRPFRVFAVSSFCLACTSPRCQRGNLEPGSRAASLDLASPVQSLERVGLARFPAADCSCLVFMSSPTTLVLMAPFESSLRPVVVTTVLRDVLCTTLTKVSFQGFTSGDSHWSIYIVRKRVLELGGPRPSVFRGLPFGFLPEYLWNQVIVQGTVLMWKGSYYQKRKSAPRGRPLRRPPWSRRLTRYRPMQPQWGNGGGEC